MLLSELLHPVMRIKAAYRSVGSAPMGTDNTRTHTDTLTETSAQASQWFTTAILVRHKKLKGNTKPRLTCKFATQAED